MCRCPSNYAVPIVLAVDLMTSATKRNATTPDEKAIVAWNKVEKIGTVGSRRAKME